MFRFAWVLMACCLVLSSGREATAFSPSRIVLVQGTASVPNEPSHNFAKTRARHLDRWLNEIGIPHLVVNDEAVTRDLLAPASLVILGYSPYPTRDELAALKAFLDRGGKLMVFYGADPALAAAMGLRLGGDQSGDANRRWCAIRFTSSAPAHLPPLVLQESRSIRPAFPAGGNSRVIAFWDSANGKAGPDPAWLQSDQGLWMSHVLFDDGDTENRKAMLLGLIATVEPGVWRVAAARCLEQAGQLGRYRNVSETISAIRQKTGATAAPRLTAALNQAAACYAGMKQGVDQSRFPDVVEKSRQLNRLLTDAYAMAQTPRTDAFRGVWNHSGTGLYPNDWDRTCRALTEHGITDILVNLGRAGEAHYASRIVPPSFTFRQYGDQAAKSVEAAHRHGLRAHFWKICWSLDGAAPAVIEEKRKAGRLQVTDTGRVLNWLCPSNPENLRYEKDIVREAIRSHAFDGLHLDYARYPDSRSCFCAGCRQRFEQAVGRPVAPWPAAATKGALLTEYRRWRCAQITRLVRDMGAVARALRPDIKISAAVYGRYPLCIDSVAQDWGSWIEQGCLDFVCPMDYTDDTEKFLALTRAQLVLPGAKGRVYPGIGVTATESRLDAVQVIDQIVGLRQQGAAGFTLFDLNRILEAEILPRLRLGVTAR